ncbi:MAG: FAD-binding oxidoreductase, partial [Myxococcota bacterium]|nr:FAD-binding oxidoreductase [Myxococcota bacterium]
MDDLRNRLLEKLEEDQLRDPQGISPPASRDLCGHPLGSPAMWVVPRNTADVQHVVRAARLAGVSVVPVGKRTAYWRPLEYTGAVVLEMSGLNGLGHAHGSAEPIWVGAGVEVRDLDEHLRRAGRRLACHPDAFGDTSIGAMVSTGFAAGCGLGTTGLDGLVAGLVVVLGTGEVLRTGAANALGHAPFTRAGLPDPTGLFYGSDGALGIVTEVAVRPWAVTPSVQVSAELPSDLISTLGVVELARSLREPGSYETLRCVAVAEPGGGESQRLDVVVRDSEAGGVLGSRVQAVRDAIRSCLSGVHLEETEDGGGDAGGFPRWRGERGEAWEMLKG